MATTALGTAAVTTLKVPPSSLQTPEPWHRTLPDIQLQLTSQNLRNLGAALKTRNVPGQTPKASPSPSDSDSSCDSETNHRIHRSTKRVCVREDMNTTREISPCPPRPVVITIPDSYDLPKAKWQKPDTPAPWQKPTQSVGQEEAEGRTPSHVPESRRSTPGLVIQLSRLSLSPIKISGSVKLKRNASKNVATGKVGANPTKERCFQTRGGSGIGMRRRSQFALPRPLSLAKPCRLLFIGSPRSFLKASAPRFLNAGHLASTTSVVRNKRESLEPASMELASRCTIVDPAADTFDTSADDLNYYPCAAAPPAPATYRSLPDRLGQPRTYVDHVRAQRLPPSALQSRITVVEAQWQVDSTKPRSASV